MRKRDEPKKRKVCGTGTEQKAPKVFYSILSGHEPLRVSRYEHGPIGWSTGAEETKLDVAAGPRGVFLYNVRSLSEPAMEEKVTYDEFKRDMTHIIHGAVEGAVDVRIRKTEQLICDRMQLTEREILNAIKNSPYAFFDLFSKIGLVGFALFFALYIISRIELVNPAFALFGVLACGLYFIISKYGESKDKGARKTDGP